MRWIVGQLARVWLIGRLHLLNFSDGLSTVGCSEDILDPKSEVSMSFVVITTKLVITKGIVPCESEYNR